MQDVQAQQAKQAQEEEARENMLSSVLTAEAKERIRTISLVKPEKVRPHFRPANRPAGRVWLFGVLGAKA